MTWLREHIDTITYGGDRAKAFAAVVRNLQRLQIPIEKKSERDGTILIRCLSRPLNLFLWRCWSEKLLIQLTDDADCKTNIRLDAIPNLFRISIEKHEREAKLDGLLAELARSE